MGFGRVEPPARYDHEPSGKVNVWRLPQAKVTEFCRRLTGKRRVVACSIPTKGVCLVIIPEGSPPIVLRHERAHCSGWPGNHPP